MAQVVLTYTPLDPQQVQKAVEASGYGAVVLFSGNVRDNALGNRVLYLEYEAYAPLADKTLRQIAEKAEQGGNVSCAIAHRLGRLEIGECSVVVAVAAPHRTEAFTLCQWVMDTLKATVPIWKKEHFDGGTHWIEGPNAVAATPRDQDSSSEEVGIE